MTRIEKSNLLILFNDSKLLKKYTLFSHVLVLGAVIANDLAWFIKLFVLIGVNIILNLYKKFNII